MRALRATAWVGSLAVLGALGCGKSTAPAPIVPASALPVVGTRGDLPASPRMEVEVAADGGVYVDGRALEWPMLVTEATRRAAAAGLDASGISTCAAVLRVDARARWDVVAWVMTVFADPHVRIADLFFTVRGEEDGAEGALFLPLPQDRCCGGKGSSGTARIAVSAGEVAPPRAATYQAIWAALHAAGERSAASITAPADVAAGSVLEVADLCLRASAIAVYFTGVRSKSESPDPPPSGLTTLQAHVARAGPARPGYELKSGDFAATAATDVVELPSPPTGLRQAPLARRKVVDTGSAGVPGKAGESPEETELIHATDEIARVPELEIAREPVLRETGRTEDEVDRALAWLAAHQRTEGHWSVDRFGEWCRGEYSAEARTDGAGRAEHEVGVTALALLCFLGAGYSSRSESPYGTTVSRAVDRLRSLQTSDGSFGSRDPDRCRYGDAFATLALVQEASVTGKPAPRQAADRALRHLAAIPLRDSGPGFELVGHGDTPGDLFLTACIATAFLAAREHNTQAAAEGKPLVFAFDSPLLLERIPVRFHELTGSTGRVEYGGAQSPVGPSTTTDALTAASVWTRIQLGETFRSSGDLVLGAQRLRNLPPRWDPRLGAVDFSYWYFGMLAAYAIGGDTWKPWSEASSAAVLHTQRKEGGACGLRGSWDPVDVWGGEGGRVYTTAILCLCCEVYLRYEKVFVGRMVSDLGPK